MKISVTYTPTGARLLVNRARLLSGVSPLERTLSRQFYSIADTMQSGQWYTPPIAGLFAGVCEYRDEPTAFRWAAADALTRNYKEGIEL
jgi:hypothetical protein